MRKVLIFDETHPLREALVETIKLTGNADVVLVTDSADAAAKIRDDLFAAVLIDTSTAGDQLPEVLAAVRHAPVRPLVVAVDNNPRRELDPDLISLVVRKPYEVTMLAGILLAALTDTPRGEGEVRKSAGNE